MTLATKLKLIMAEKKMTRYQVSKLSGICVTTIEKWIYTNKTPSLSALNCFAESLNVPLSELFEGVDSI